MNLKQAIKMAWKSIWGKKGRSALTILGIFIGIAAVMTIVSISEGLKMKSMEQFEAMGSNRITVGVYTNLWDENGNPILKDYFPDIYDYCNTQDTILGVTPTARPENVTLSYNTVSTANMEMQYDENYNVLSAPPEQFYGSDQYSACNNLQVFKGRDLVYLDMGHYNQVCVLGWQAAKLFFGSSNPIGKVMQANGHNFEVVGVYAPRVDPDGPNKMMDNFVVYPYTASRVLGNSFSSQYLVKASSSEVLSEAMSNLGGFLKGLIPPAEGSYNVYSESQFQEESNEFMSMIGMVLGGIAAISLLVGGIGIMNIMLVTVTERTREIGIRRSLGAQRSSIVAQFLIEAAMLCAIGGLVGILFGTIGSVTLSKMLVHMTIYPPLRVTLSAFGLSVALGVIFGSYPAVKASKLQPVEALRAE